MSAALPSTLRQPLTPEETREYGQVFRSLDAESLGVVTGEAARGILESSGLPPTVLGEIWQLADPTNLGFLTQFAFCVALRLIGHVQNGAKPDRSLIEIAGPLAKVTGVSSTASTTTGPAPGVSSPIPQQPLSAQVTSLPPLTNLDISKFSQLFAKSAPSGVISGEQARNIFLKAKLPTNVLSQVWALVDRNNSGQLSRDEFVVAMFLIQGSLNGSIKQLPPTLPETVWHQVAGYQSPVVTGGSSNASFNPQLTGARPQTSRVPSSFGDAANDWSISPQKKAQFDSIFEGLDKQSKGVLGPNEVAPFLMTSKLPQDTLASIWDLADINNTGEFTKDEFAIAMFLVQKKVAGAELPDVIPDSLLPNSHPGSQQHVASPALSQQAHAPVAVQPKIPSRETKPKSSMNDLLDLSDAFGTPSPTVETRNVSNSTVNYTPTGGAPKAFVPTSSFGQDLFEKNNPESHIAPHTTGSPAQSPESSSATVPATQQTVKQVPSFTSQPTGSTPFPQPPSSIGSRQPSTQSVQSPPASTANYSRNLSAIPANSDLLADSNPEISGQLSQATTDMANLSNQIGSLTQQTSQLHDKRTRAENELTKITNLKKDIESKLTKLRVAYQQEVKQTEQVESLLTSSKAETEELRRESSVAEAQYNQVQTKLQALQAELEETQKENATLKERIGTLNAEQIEANKELERVQGEVKKSRGLIAINSKQLNMSEVKSTGIREEIAALLSSVKELDSHHANYTQKQTELQSLQQQIEENERGLRERQQAHQEANIDFSAKEEELSARLAEQKQREAQIQQQEERIQQYFANLQERQRQLEAAEAQLNQQQVEYAQRIQSFTERQIQDATTGYSQSQVESTSNDFSEEPQQQEPETTTARELEPEVKRESEETPSSTSEGGKTGLIAAAVGAVAGGIGATAVAATTASNPTGPESERGNTEFSSPVASTTDHGTSVNSEPYDQYPTGGNVTHLDIERAESTTSSVQNNAPQSVRGDDIEETPTIETITEQPALASDVLAKDYNPSALRTAAATLGAEEESSGAGSFELVDAHKSDVDLSAQNPEAPSTDTSTVAAPTADDIESSIPGAWADHSSSAAVPVTSDAQAPASVVAKDDSDDLEPASEAAQKFPDIESSQEQRGVTGTEEFPPIQELEINESDSDDDDEFHETNDNIPSGHHVNSTSTPVESNFSTSAALGAGLGLGTGAAAISASKGADTNDAFDFEGLEEAQAEQSFNNEEDEFQPQNFNEELEGTTFFGAEDAQNAAFSGNHQQQGQTPASQDNEEWEQIFAGFGNQSGQQQQTSSTRDAYSQQQSQPFSPQPVQGHTDSFNTTTSSHPKIATTPRSLAVQELTGMGFSQEEALKALEKEKWNLEAATNFLLDNA